MDLNHFELCKITATRFSKESLVTLYEYQSYSTSEFPDVLCFKRKGNAQGIYRYRDTALFEIKTSRSDFKADLSKEARIEKRIKYTSQWEVDRMNRLNISWEKDSRLQELITEKPHLGVFRYYVCIHGLIRPEEINNGWGLYWYDGKFKIQKESKRFKNNIYMEQDILLHAFRKFASEKEKEKLNIIINTW